MEIPAPSVFNMSHSLTITNIFHRRMEEYQEDKGGNMTARDTSGYNHGRYGTGSGSIYRGALEGHTSKPVEPEPIKLQHITNPELSHDLEQLVKPQPEPQFSSCPKDERIQCTELNKNECVTGVCKLGVDWPITVSIKPYEQMPLIGRSFSHNDNCTCTFCLTQIAQRDADMAWHKEQIAGIYNRGVDDCAEAIEAERQERQTAHDQQVRKAFSEECIKTLPIICAKCEGEERQRDATIAHIRAMAEEG